MSLAGGAYGARETMASAPAVIVLLVTVLALLAVARSATLTLFRVGLRRTA